MFGVFYSNYLLYNLPMKKFYPFLFFITILMLVFMISANVQIFDYDLWARLIAGMGVIDGHTVLKTDFLSYTPTHTWWDHEYGSGVIFYFFLKHFGGYSLIFLQTVIFFLIIFFTTRIIKLRHDKSFYNMLFWILPIIALQANFGSPIRCHLFSFLFFTIFLYILEKVRQGSLKLLYLLPILTIIWNNLHGGVVAGLGLIGMYAISEILDKKPVKHYLYAGILSCAALLINPWGFDYIKFLLMANTMKRPDITEWWGIFSKPHLYNQIPFKIFMILIIGLEGYKIYTHKMSTQISLWKDLDKAKFIVILTTLFLAIQHIKLLPFFVITATAFCYEDFADYIENKLPKYTEKLTLILIILISLIGLSMKKYELPLGASQYPHREVEFIKINDIKGNILVNFGLGSFVSYKTYPHNKIFMDGRYEEVYYDEMVPLLKKFYLLNPDWDEVLKKYPPDIMIIEKYYPVYEKLNELPKWTNVFDTENFGVFIKTENRKKTYTLPDNTLEYYKNTLFDTSIKF